MIQPEPQPNPMLEHAYVAGQFDPSFPAMLDAFQTESDRVAERDDAKLDLRYGPHPRQLLDFFPSPTPSAPVVIYFHAGYWQSRDKKNFRFLANGFNEAGFHCALVNYPLCPDVSLTALIDAASRSIKFVTDFIPNRPVILAGHSAGAHLAIELGMRRGGEAPPIKRILAISGIFDVRPLISTTLNERLRLNQAEATAVSPVLRAKAHCPSALFAVGGDETAAFKEQSRSMSSAWINAGNDSQYHEFTSENHFSILREISNSNSVLYKFLKLTGERL